LHSVHSAGHLPLHIGKAAAATLTMIQEDYLLPGVLARARSDGGVMGSPRSSNADQKIPSPTAGGNGNGNVQASGQRLAGVANLYRQLSFSELADKLEAAILKRKVQKREYGLAILSSGLLDLLDPAEVKERFGSLQKGRYALGAGASANHPL
jgi:hypothetical protein